MEPETFVWVRRAKCHASLEEAGDENVVVWEKAEMRHGTIWEDRSLSASDDEKKKLLLLEV